MGTGSKEDQKRPPICSLCKYMTTEDREYVKGIYVCANCAEQMEKDHEQS